MSHSIIIQTSSSNRIIRQTLQALIRSQAIVSAHKIPYIKHYITNEKGSLTVEKIQILIMTPGAQRTQSGEKILNNILKNRSLQSDIFNS